MKRTLTLLLLKVILLSVPGAGYASPVHCKSLQRSESTEQFLSGTERGRVVLVYLRCTDFDCIEAQKNVVKLGADVVPPLIKLLESEVPRMIAPDWAQDKLALVVRTRVIDALGELQDERALEILVKSTRNASPQIRAASAAALARINGDRALSVLIPLLKDDDQLVREVTAKSLGKLQRPEALAPLQAAARRESAQHVRLAMEAAIKSIQQR